MPLKIGTNDLASLAANATQSIADYGLEEMNEAVQADLAAHNAIIADLTGDVALSTTDRQRLSGIADIGEMIDADEYSAAPTQRPAGFQTVGFPLRKVQYAIGWTREWFRMKTPADMARQVFAAQKAHIKRLIRDMKRAIYGSANYSFFDRLGIPQVALAVKRFVNADSLAIPEGPNGEVFDAATHTHYLASATLTAGALTSLVATVLEHGHGNRIVIAINVADEAAVRALAGFIELRDPRLEIRTDTNQTIDTIDLSRANNRKIGLFGAAEVWVKPWAIASYAVAYDAEDDRKPLVKRLPTFAGMSGLAVAAELDAFPLHAQFMEDHFGFGTWNRTNGAVLDFGSGTYRDPVINS